MRLARFGGQNACGLALVRGDGLVPLGTAVPAAPQEMSTLISEWETWKPHLEALRDKDATVALDDVTLLAPIARPGKVLGIGLNYADHVSESGMEQPSDQLWFS